MSAVSEVVVPSGGRSDAGNDETPPTDQETNTSVIAEGNSNDVTSAASKDGAKQSGSMVYTEGSDFEQWSQCGLEDDEDECVEYVFPPRITTSQLTPEEKARCKRILDRIFSHDCAVMCRKAVFSPEDIFFVAEGVVPYLESEPVLIEDLTWPITIVGDIHGQLHDIHLQFAANAKDGKPGWECAKFLFLGNYVDRGRQNMEVVMALFCIKMLFPDNVILLRGNHEFPAQNICHGFMRDLSQMYEKKMAKEIYIALNCTFGFLSFAAIVGDIYFCVHGGVSPQATRHTLRSFTKPIVCSTQDKILNDLVWSDPAIGLKGGCVNGERGKSLYYGLNFLLKAMNKLDVKIVFRSHSQLEKGYEVHWDLLVSLFSCVDVGGSGNKGAVAAIDGKGEVTFHVTDPCPKRRALEKALDALEEKEKKVAQAKNEEGQKDPVKDKKTAMGGGGGPIMKM